MKMTSFSFFSVCVLIFTSGVISAWKYPEDRETAGYLFRVWKDEHNKTYRGYQEELQKFEVFRENLRVINNLNVMFEGKTIFALNQFADISESEFKKTRLMPARSAPKFESSRYIRPHRLDPLPDSFDWTTKNVVTPVKDQGAGGTCWAFSTIGNIEGQWALAGQPLTNLSVEQVVDCDGMEDVPNMKADCGVFGGWPYLAYQYIKKAGGLEKDDDYWYCAGLGGAPGTCEVCPAPGYNDTLCGPSIPYCNMTQSCVFKLDVSKFIPGLKVADWKAVDENETVIANTLMKTGPLSIALNAALVQFYHKGVYDPPKALCNPKNLDHAVLLVGFGTEKTIFETKEFWKIKNSWGPKWGENGYFRILRNKGVCGINTQVTTAVLQKP